MGLEVSDYLHMEHAHHPMLHGSQQLVPVCLKLEDLGIPWQICPLPSWDLDCKGLAALLNPGGRHSSGLGHAQSKHCAVHCCFMWLPASKMLTAGTGTRWALSCPGAAALHGLLLLDARSVDKVHRRSGN